MFGILAADIVPGSRASSVPWLIGMLSVAARGQLLMLIHFYAASGVSAAEKKEWSARLWWGGPFVASLYLWFLGRTLRPSGPSEPSPLQPHAVSECQATLAGLFDTGQRRTRAGMKLAVDLDP